MQNSRNADRKMRVDWAAALQVVACSLLFCVFIVATKQAPASDWRVAGYLAYLAYLIAAMWRQLFPAKRPIEGLRLNGATPQR